MKINIVCLDNPYPPNYGGAIDIFFRIKQLYNQGCKIYLYCFYSDREPRQELNYFCEKVYYYKRKSFLQTVQNILTPFIVSSRKSNKLLSKLLSNKYPIFFDGLQSTFISSRKELKNRKKYLRIHNIESIYMKKLSTSENELVRKVGLKIDSLRYNYFERRLNHFDKIFTISLNDQNFYKNYHKKVHLLSVFHGHQKVKSKEGFGDYIFYHGNFDVSENLKAAIFLIKNVFNQIHIPVKIAGRSVLNKLKKYTKNTNIELVDSPSVIKMQELIINAQINVLPTFQATGFKLKLINSLFLGRHCIVNNEMIASSNRLQTLCILSNSSNEFIKNIKKLFSTPFTKDEVNKRKILLMKYFNDIDKSKALIKQISNE